MSSTPRIWTTEDAHLLQSLREAAGLDISILAKRHSLSIHQVRQLEEGGQDRFYSQAIKLQVGRKLLRSLGGDLVELPEPVAAELVVEQPVMVIPQPLHASAVVRDTTQSTGLPKSPSRMWISLGGLALVAMAWLGWQQAAQQAHPQKKTVDAVAVADLKAEPVAAVSQPADATAVPMSQPSNTPEATDIPPVASSTPEDAGPLAQCNFGADPVRVSVFEPRKPGNYVYFEAQQAVQVCVKDAAQQTTVLELPAGIGRTVRGTAPFEVLSQQFDAMRIFYQGKMVAPGLLTASHVVLRPQAIVSSAPAAN
jgi:hypothetical protein